MLAGSARLRLGNDCCGRLRTHSDGTHRWGALAGVGRAVARKFNNRHPLPLKLIACVMMLSLQAHPNPTQARTAIRKSGRWGIAVNIGNYKDPSAKTENRPSCWRDL